MKQTNLGNMQLDHGCFRNREILRMQNDYLNILLTKGMSNIRYSLFALLFISGFKHISHIQLLEIVVGDERSDKKMKSCLACLLNARMWSYLLYYSTTKPFVDECN